ncbi:hypothetical protein WJX81_000516 [Elliptochloris bilobata]|uniref:Uncharacterized protein n=1 Tax=Elliptochloris bilobata TaxID=381761 RepID=A0AAW1RGG1_9CHLO
MDKQRCFTEARIRECLQVASDAWTDFVRDCQTFQDHQIAGVAGRRRRRLAAAGGEGASANLPEPAGRVGCFPPFSKWQDFEVWLAISDAGAVAKSAALQDAAHDEALRVGKSTEALPKPIRTHRWMAVMPQPACDERMDKMRQSYYASNATEKPQDGGACDSICRASCLDLLDDTWSARLHGRTCPARDVLLRCLLVARDDWVDFVKDCETFQINFTPEGGADQAHKPRLADEGEGAPPPPPSSGGGEGAASAAPTTTSADGCFPDFQTWKDFEYWLDGKLVEVGPDYGRPSPVGLVSVFVFAGLIGSMAFF